MVDKMEFLLVALKVALKEFLQLVFELDEKMVVLKGEPAVAKLENEQAVQWDIGSAEKLAERKVGIAVEWKV